MIKKGSVIWPQTCGKIRGPRKAPKSTEKRENKYRTRARWSNPTQENYLNGITRDRILENNNERKLVVYESILRLILHFKIKLQRNLKKNVAIGYWPSSKH